MDDFYNFLNPRYHVKRLGRPVRYLGLLVSYLDTGDIAITETLVVEETLDHAGILHCNSKRTPYFDGITYKALVPGDEYMTETVPNFHQLIGDLRYSLDCSGPDIIFILRRLWATAAKPSKRHWHILNSELGYLAGTTDH